MIRTAKKLGERIAAVERQLNEPMAQVAAPHMAGIALACEKEVQQRRPSKEERRAKLIAAHVALEAVRRDLGDYAEYEAINKTQASICAAIGRLELRD
jgi:hypothetical protein